jgi:hypothetical protein
MSVLATAPDVFRAGALGGRGYILLLALATPAGRGHNAAVLARLIGQVDRTTASRLLHRCEQHGLANRDDRGGWHLGDVTGEALTRAARAFGTERRSASAREQKARQRLAFRQKCFPNPADDLEMLRDINGEAA